jgi:hypothetical protein
MANPHRPAHDVDRTPSIASPARSASPAAWSSRPRLGCDCEEEQEVVAALAEAHLERLEAISAGLAEIIRQQARERSTAGLAPRSS